MSLTLTFPWILFALVGVPLLWRVLKAAPPPPRVVRFPGLFFLQGLQNRQETPGIMPLWLLVLRSLLVVALILAAAGPVWRPQGATAPPERPLWVLLDNSFAAQGQWDRILATADRLVTLAFAVGRPVAWRALAPQPDGTQPGGVLNPAEWQKVQRTLQPSPLLPELAATLQSPPDILKQPADVVIVSAGLLPGAKTAWWLGQLQAFGTPQVIVPGGNPPAVAFTGLDWQGDTATVTLSRWQVGGTLPQSVRLVDAQGAAVAEAPVTFAGDDRKTKVSMRLPADVARTVRQVRLSGEAALGGLWLTGGGWALPPVGIIGDGAGTASLTDERHYVRQALATAGIRSTTAPLDQLLEEGTAVLVWPDSAVLATAERQRLADAVANGLVLVRLAGDNLAAASGLDPLLPVRLRPGKRVLGGKVGGEATQTLAAYTDKTPLAGLQVPDNVQVNAQVVAVPDPDLPGRTWATMADGTPLVTARPEGRGWLVLLHTTATPAWCTLVYSGGFVDIWRQLARLGMAGGQLQGGPDLQPFKMLDAAGQLQTPGLRAKALPVAGELPVPGLLHPPGLYGGAGEVALNMGPAAAALLSPVRDVVGNVPVITGVDAPRPLWPWLLLAAFLLLVLDTLLTLRLRGLLAPASVLFLLCAGQASAQRLDQLQLLYQLQQRQQPAQPQAPPLDRIGWISSGDAAVDRTTEQGLATLSRILAARTSVELAPPAQVKPGQGVLARYALVYWPLAGPPPVLAAAARDELADWLRHQGMLFIDTRAAASPAQAAERLQQVNGLLGELGIAAVQPVDDGHVLHRTFYLLQRFPGRWTADTLHVPPAGDDPDPVAPVVVGGNDYAAAWAMATDGRPAVAALPQGALQREQALRVGVNVMLYALTGTYKSDQIHLDTILRRLD